MTVNEDCPICQGRCCEYGVDDYRGASRRGAHRSESIHTCPYCTNGTKPTVWTAEQERAAVVAWLRGLRAIGQGRELYLVLRWADAIERGEHRREETP